MKYFSIFLLIALIGCKSRINKNEQAFVTFCNPVNISYRFCMDEPSRREAADPTVIWFKDRYYLFASKSGGYWHSIDLAEWTFIETSEIPVEEYAPTAIGIGDTLYFLASSNELSTIYKTADPISGKWSVAREVLDMPVWDPAFFMDDDNRLYLYWGCSDVNPIYGVEIDYQNNFSFIGQPEILLTANPAEHGWEVPGDYNTLTGQKPWIEGAWMNKHNGVYYLQYSGPGTEFKSYSDGVYIAEKPLGPFALASHNPFAYKPEGFAAGAGHGSTFEDNHGNFWHIGTITISVKHMFERRLGLYPTFFDQQGTLHAITKFGDYPMILPKSKVSGFDDLFAGWMLLSYNKPVNVSSAIDQYPAANMVNEDIRTYWAAQTGNAGEFATIDLEGMYDVYAIQINFAEHETAIFGRQKDLYHRYVIECSNDGVNWQMLVDKSANMSDQSHDYIQLPQKVNCRYIKIINKEVSGGNFALSGFRVFGKGDGEQPQMVENLKGERKPDKRRTVSLNWDKSENATGYNISYGVDKDKLYHNYMVYSDTALVINSLNANLGYYFTIESFNENGITKSKAIAFVE